MISIVLVFGGHTSTNLGVLNPHSKSWGVLFSPSSRLRRPCHPGARQNQLDGSRRTRSHHCWRTEDVRRCFPVLRVYGNIMQRCEWYRSTRRCCTLHVTLYDVPFDVPRRVTVTRVARYIVTAARRLCVLMLSLRTVRQRTFSTTPRNLTTHSPSWRHRPSRVRERETSLWKTALNTVVNWFPTVMICVYYWPVHRRPAPCYYYY